ncbi:MAG: DUF4258 domain-containing protein [Candidatus Anammoxibacter sp.]
MKEIVKDNKHHYTIHAQEQMAFRHIRNSEIVEVISCEKAEIIEEYPSDKYSPSSLIYGITTEGRILHDQSNYQGVIITVYEPNLTKWNDDMKTRRR